MKQKSRLLVLLLPMCAAAVPAIAQSEHATPMAASAPTVVPALVPYAASALGSDGKPLTGETQLTFELFTEEQGGEPLWVESQTVAIDSSGHYQVQLGASSPSGLPLTTFASGEGRWLEIQIAGQKAAPRVLMTSVPYAMKAADAATLGGLPASAYALAGTSSQSAQPTIGGSPESGSAVTTPGGTSGYLPTFTAAAVIGNSVLFQKGTYLGIGTTAPASTLDVNGSAIVRGQLSIENAGVATSSAGQQSHPLAFFASSYNSSSKTANSPTFEFKAEPTGNNTAAPSGTLNLLYTNGGTPGETGLSINSSGVLHFATGQTFPGSGTGSGTITGVTAGTGLTGGGTSGAVTLNVNTGQIPTLTGNNTYSGSNVFQPSLYTNLDMNIDNNNQNSGGISPGLRLGQASGEGMASKRTSGGNQYGLDLYTDYSSRMSINAAGQVSIGTSPSSLAQLAVSGSSDGVLGTTGGSVLHTAGVFGVAGSGNTSGFNGISGVWGDSNAHVAVLGTSTQYPGVEGYSGSSSGIYGQSNSTSSGDAAVYALSSTGATGLVGISTTGIGAIIEGGTPTNGNNTTAGAGLDVYGGTSASYGGTATAYTGGPAINAYGGYGGNGENGGTGLNAYGGTGSYLSSGAGIVSTGGSGSGSGGAGIVATGGSGSDFGGDGIAAFGGSGTDGYGIYAKPGSGGIAGSFQGNIDVTGTVETNGQAVKIDSPTDPANKYLVHASVQSSEMMNIYTGNVTTDELGLATIQLPAWFETENSDFRYQLTVVGRKAQAWISQEIEGGKFQISSDATSTKVSWQVTAVRQDAYAKANPLVVEQTKPANERGFYMHPELYGQPATKQTEWGRRPEFMKHIESVRNAQKNLSKPPVLAVPRNEAAKASR